MRRYYDLNRKVIRERQAVYYQQNKDTLAVLRHQNRSAEAQRSRLRYRVDAKYRLTKILRSRLTKGLVRAGFAVRDLGCTIDELRVHLEALFRPGMTWENWGDWHIDHVRPLASFNLTDRAQFLQACRYTNLQPLWAAENLKKGASYGDVG